MANKDQQPYMPGEEAKKRGDVPTGESRNKDYGKGRQSGVVAEESKHDKEQQAELELNERNR